LKRNLSKRGTDSKPVAPSRERGLKLVAAHNRIRNQYVAPSRERGLKPRRAFRHRSLPRRSFTGAWIETGNKSPLTYFFRVAPSRERGLKPCPCQQLFGSSLRSLLHGSVD